MGTRREHSASLAVSPSSPRHAGSEVGERERARLREKARRKTLARASGKKKSPFRGGPRQFRPELVGERACAQPRGPPPSGV